MAARTPLAQFIFDRIRERGETPEEFAARIGINASGLYKLLRGAYAEPRQATLDKIATGLSMTPAELFVAIGKGKTDTSPEETEILALYREVPHEQRPAVRLMLRGLRRRVTDNPEAFDSSNPSRNRPNVQPTVPRRRESQSVKHQVSKWGLQPAY
jgi:transcriptional regulator with XRE-family HTH domain